MEHMHLCVNLANDTANNQPSAVSNTGILIKINKALFISRKQNLFFNEEYYKYAIELKVNGEYWVIFRRYSEIRDEHERMCKKYANLKKESFPPRSPFNKNDSFQIERQQKLQEYLKSLIEIVLGDNIYNFSPTLKSSKSPEAPVRLTKDMFCQLFPFFVESAEDKLNVQKLGWIFYLL
jgi:hypothetical protein